jgi:alanyl-tRNA synthetase
LEVGQHNGVPIYLHIMDSLAYKDMDLLRKCCDKLVESKSNAIHLILGCDLKILCAIDPKNLPQVHAGNFLRKLLSDIGGRGGGKQHLAEGVIANEIRESFKSIVQNWCTNNNK